MVHHAISGDLTTSRHWLFLRDFLHSNKWKAVAGLLVLVVVGQLLYPTDRGLMNAAVNGESVKLKTQADIARIIENQFSNSKVQLAIGSDKTSEVGLKSLGARIDSDEITQRMTAYSFWQRLIPGSILWQGGNVTTVNVLFDEAKLQSAAATQAALLSFPAVNARLSVKNGELKTINPIDSSGVDPKELGETVRRGTYTIGRTNKIEAPSTRLPAARPANIDEVRQEAEEIIKHTVKITVAGRDFTPDKTERGSWLTITSVKDNKLALSVNEAKIKTYLTSINKQVGKPAGITSISMKDGREVSRKPGAMGRGIDVDSLSKTIARRLKTPPLEITIATKLQDIPPTITYNNHYSASEAGLRAYVADVARTKNMHIVVQQFRPGGWYASARENESIPSASTYKLYVALVLFDKINRGQIHWDDKMLGTTVSGCLERMIVVSANDCAQEWIKQFGARNINNFLYARGFSTGTNFLAADATHTTAADLHKFIAGLNDGTLIGGSNRLRLLNLMNQQVFRNGIPAGSAGPVYDKVGFLWDYNHDAAIVKDPHGTYGLIIMTKGQSFTAIAGVARQISRIMYP